jgi:hypothetical protein
MMGGPAGAVASDAARERPYAGQQNRAIASLSEQDVAELLDGAGWGFAKPAELNGYPGPRHLLDLAEELELSPEQVVGIEQAFRNMQTRARDLGAEFVAAEADLNAAFRAGDVDQDSLRALTVRAGELWAALRETHLAAHLQVRPLLSRHQIHEYNRLRGYEDGAETGHHTHSGH